MSISSRLSDITASLPPTCRLIAVSKTQSVEKILEAYQAGQRVFGENKVQELVPKYEALPKDIEWHMIGHLQGNKAKYIAPFVHWIHSVDSFKLLEEINKQALKSKRVIQCLLQIHIAAEETKYGFSEDEIFSLISSNVLEPLKNVRIMGLMGMATFTENHQQIRREFQSLKKTFEKLKAHHLPSNVVMQELSMGMSGDYPIAIEEGSTMIRVGTAVFGERHYNSQN